MHVARQVQRHDVCMNRRRSTTRHTACTRCRQPQWSRGVCVRHAPNPCTYTLGRDRWGGTPIAPLARMTKFIVEVYLALGLWVGYTLLKGLLHGGC